MIVGVKRPLEALKDIYHVDETSRVQRFARLNGTVATAANNQDGPAQVVAYQPFDLLGKLRIDLPIGPFLPCHMLGTNRMADIHVLDFSPAIDEHCVRIFLKQCMGGQRVEMLHGHIRISEHFDIMEASSEKRKLDGLVTLEPE
jgi:hypothetical protein